jgi:hypothetical protein
MHDDETAGVGRGTDRIVDDPAVEHRFSWQQVCEFAYVSARRPEHAAAPHPKAGGVGEHTGFHGELGGVAKRRDCVRLDREFRETVGVPRYVRGKSPPCL